MNARSLVLGGAGVIVAAIGITWLGDDQQIPTGALPTPLSRTVSGAAVSPPSVHVVGLMVNAPTHTGRSADSNDGFGVDLAFFGTFARTSLALELIYPSGGIIKMQNESCRLEIFEDDKGTPLGKDEASQLFGPFEMMPRISEGGDALVFVAASEKLPYHDAARIHAKGTVSVLVADDKKVSTTANVDLREGTTFSVGGFDFEITEAGKSQWNDSWSITLLSHRDLAPIVRFALVDPSDREIELRQRMSMQGGDTWQHTFELDEHVERAGFRIEAWQEPQPVEVPFDVSTGIGLR